MNEKNRTPLTLHRLAAGSLCSIVILLAVASPGRATAESLNPVAIEEWPVPFAGHGRDPYAAGPDEIWFVGQQGHYLARFTPSTEQFLKVDLPEGTGPHNNVVHSSGDVWYSGNRVANIGRYEPESGEFTVIAMPDPETTQDPHTLLFDADESHLWFTVQFGNKIGRMDMAGHSVEIVAVPTAGSRPYGLKLAPDGTPWIVLFGTNKLAKVDPATMALTEVTLPAADARPRRLEITSDGRIWYADFARGTIGLYDPASNEFGEWPRGTRSRPYGMAVDDEDRVWLVETGVMPNQFVGFDTASESVFSITEIPSGAGAVRHMDYEESTGSVWFGTDSDTLGRARVKSH
jgi:virginiamycin B lyase